MARRPHKPDPQQYPFDFESPARERMAMLMSALQIVGFKKEKYIALARLVFNMQERSGGDPLRWATETYASEFGRSISTMRRRLHELAAVGIFEIGHRRRERGGQQTNVISINWTNVRLLAIHRPDIQRENLEKLDRPTKLTGRPLNLPPRPSNLTGPNKEYPSYSPSPELNTSTTTALPHARPILRSEEEEISLRELIKAIRDKLKFPRSAVPAQLETSLRNALAAGCTIDQLWKRCRWFKAHHGEWSGEFRAGAFNNGIRDAAPDVRPDEGWPYQR